ncbi:hypothetical protein [Rhodococcus sp. IEGM 1302]|uniref:hypothetical protein n=1 Tax=Rhodococcus sp. IEGM 1302 TaxID=3047093 RepID=UPI0024B7FF07|nr:hypothetical protein [Rhodococcus sp. IEGM 1302]MDI9947020.1 hypothetical protein [Rhodococcus sp. IEGM 1302]
MTNARTKVCIVHFYELVLSPDQRKIPGHRWQDELDRLAPSAHKCDYNGTELEGIVVDLGSEKALSLAVDRATTPRQRNTTRPERAEMETRGNEWEPVEETFVRFFANNIIGLVRSTNSAPTHAALARWLNKTARPRGHGPNATWFALPIVDEDRYLALRDMGEVTTSTFAVKPNTIPDRPGLLGGIFDRFFDYEDGLRIEVHITAGRGRPAQRNRERMLDMAREAAALHEQGVPFERAVVNARPADGGLVEVIDLLEHKLTKKFEVTFGGDDGVRSLSEQVVFSQIRSSYLAMEESLQNAIGLQ